MLTVSLEKCGQFVVGLRCSATLTSLCICLLAAVEDLMPLCCATVSNAVEYLLMSGLPLYLVISDAHMVALARSSSEVGVYV